MSVLYWNVNFSIKTAYNYFCTVTFSLCKQIGFILTFMTLKEKFNAESTLYFPYLTLHRAIQENAFTTSHTHIVKQCNYKPNKTDRIYITHNSELDIIHNLCTNWGLSFLHIRLLPDYCIWKTTQEIRFVYKMNKNARYLIRKGEEEKIRIYGVEYLRTKEK